VGFSLWLIYGLELGVWAIAVPNAICLVCSAFILAMKLMPSQTRHRVADVLDPAVDGRGRPTSP
jgi:MtN3 and saliva related transmembrane protein